MSEPTRIRVGDLTFRDLDHDGVLAPYEDWRLAPADRAGDLLTRMTLEEKTGLLVHGTAPAEAKANAPGLGSIGIGAVYDLDAVRELVGRGVNSLISRLSVAPAALAAQNNELQEVAAAGRLGIPITLSTDPRHHFANVTGASNAPTGFSQWPETLGLAAIGDAALVRRFGDIVRQEYRAVGFHMALSPQADLGSEPRWPRFEGTFGSNPQLVRALVGAYVVGVQGGAEGLGPASVAAVVKHWVGYGASRDGFDGHNYYGRFSAFPGGRFQDHIDAFFDAFDAKVSGVMPTYNILDGLVIDGAVTEAVGAGFNRQITTGLLRETYGFRGVVLSDWAITRDFSESCRSGHPPQGPQEIAMPWGVEHLMRIDKFAKGIDAGIDQFGGENDPSVLLDAVRAGRISVERVEESAARILVQKFELGLFDDPFVDPPAGSAIVGSEEFRKEGRVAQCRSVTRLIAPPGGPALKANARVFVHGLPSNPFAEAGIATTESAANATVAVVRISAPFETLHPGHFFGQRQHEGDLEYKLGHPDLDAVVAASALVPTVVVVHLDRPAVLTNLVPHAAALFAVYGVADDVLVDVLRGAAEPEGRLPFPLPSSMASVLAHHCDQADDLQDPLFALYFTA